MARIIRGRKRMVEMPFKKYLELLDRLIAAVGLNIRVIKKENKSLESVLLEMQAR